MGCTLSVKIHPNEHLSPYNRLLRRLGSPIHKTTRGNPLRHTVHMQKGDPPKKVSSTNSCGALFVGINTYKNWPPLSCAVRDATCMAEKFIKLGFQTTLLADKDATCSSILQHIESCATSYDTFVIGLYGHGICPGEIGGMFIPVDASKESHSYDKIHASILKTVSERSRATSGVFILDFCYSGSFLQSNRRMRGHSWSEELENERSRIVLTSGLSHQRVEDGTINSPFTDALLSAIDEHGVTSIVQLYLTIRERLTAMNGVSCPKMGRYPSDGGGDVFLKRKSI